MKLYAVMNDEHEVLALADDEHKYSLFYGVCIYYLSKKRIPGLELTLFEVPADTRITGEYTINTTYKDLKVGNFYNEVNMRDTVTLTKIQNDAIENETYTTQITSYDIDKIAKRNFSDEEFSEYLAGRMTQETMSKLFTYVEDYVVSIL